MKFKFSVRSVVVAAGLSVATSGFAMDASLTWLGHAAFKYVSQSGKVILIDPWITNPKAPKNVSFTHVDAILVTHGHSDHVGEAFDLAKKFNAPLVASYELTIIAAKQGVKTIMPINPSGSVDVAGIKVTATEAVHSSGYKEREGEPALYAGAPLGFVVQEYGVPTIYHAGDTGVFEDMALISRLYQPSIALLPIGGVFTMKPTEAAMATQLLATRVIIPMHYGTFPALAGTPEQLEKELMRMNNPTHVHVMVPGKEEAIKNLK